MISNSTEIFLSQFTQYSNSQWFTKLLKLWKDNTWKLSNQSCYWNLGGIKFFFEETRENSIYIETVLYLLQRA